MPYNPSDYDPDLAEELEEEDGWLEEEYKQRNARKSLKAQGIEVCDYCINVAYDNGIQGYAFQAEAMMLLGADLEDHLCDMTEEPDLPIECACACHPGAKARVRKGRKEGKAA